MAQNSEVRSIEQVLSMKYWRILPLFSKRSSQPVRV